VTTWLKKCPCLATESKNMAHTCSFMTAVLQWLHSQTELIFWITLVYDNVTLADSSILTVCDNAGRIKERAWCEKEVFV